MGVQDKPRYQIVRVSQNPAPGAEFVIPNSGVGNWLVLSIVAVLTTSAVVANRLVTLVADDGTTIYWRGGASAVQAASLVDNYSAFAGASGSPAVANFVPIDFPGDGLWLPQGFRLRSQTTAIDVGDQYSAIALQVLELPIGPEIGYLPVPNLIAIEGE